MKPIPLYAGVLLLSGTMFPVNPVPVAENSPGSKVRPVPQFLHKSLEWLAAAQFENGGWGAGSHSNQSIRDPRAVQIDPATTAFSAMALMRSGSSLREGPYSKNIARALSWLLETVEESPEETPNITSLTGTQPQVKMGQNVDVTMCAQFFSRVLPQTTRNAKLRERLTSALNKCLRKIERGQSRDGSWAAGGWAGVLQSAMANSALELAQAVGIKVDEVVLDKSREYQKGNLDAKTGAVRTESAAGVSLYSITSNQRATAAEARDAEQRVAEAKEKGLLKDDAPVSKESLMEAGVREDDANRLAKAHEQNKAAQKMLSDESVMAGFGNNGGEEYLSYMMTSESMVITGDAEYESWYEKMSGRLGKIQNSNGSWTGHHCITSPVFCTAAVIMTLTADREGDVLVKEHKKQGM